MMKALAKGIHSNSTKHSPKLGYKESSSFRQNEPDLYLILGCKIFPTHKVYANRSAFISQKIQTDEKVIIIEIEIEVKRKLKLDLTFRESPRVLVRRNIKI